MHGGRRVSSLVPAGAVPPSNFQRRRKHRFGFNGLQPSTTTSIRYFPVEGVGVVALCNAEVVSAKGDQDLSSLLDSVLKVVLPDNQ